MDPASMDTRDAKRNEHLKSADFFDVENHKEITFVGNRYEKLMMIEAINCMAISPSKGLQSK